LIPIKETQMADMALMLRAAEEIRRSSQSEDVCKLAAIVADLCRELDTAERDARRIRTAKDQSPSGDRKQA